MEAEDIIRQYTTTRNPFRVPDGYFDDFTQRLMQRLPQEAASQTTTPRRARIVSLSPARRLMRYAAAVMVAAACLGSGLYLYNRSASDTDDILTASDYLANDDNLDDMLDYEMLSNNQIAYYLTEAY